MRRFQTLLYSFLGLAIAASAQNPAYPIGLNFFPDDTIGLSMCVYNYTSSGGVVITTPEPGVTVQFNTPTVTSQSGFHQHDGLVGNPTRPIGTYLGSTSAVTGSDGCSPSLAFQLPGIAGIYTFTGTYTNLEGVTQTKGVNNYVFYYGVSGGQYVDLVPYPDNSNINAPAGLHVDYMHFGQSRWLQPNVAANLTAASTNYVSLTSQAGVIDRLDIYRGSLPWGGISDNEVYGASLWATRSYEEHAWGSEVDIPNANSVAPNYYVYQMQALQASGCIGGKFAPSSGGTITDPISYWMGQNLMHVVCATAAGYSAIMGGQKGSPTQPTNRGGHGR